MRRYSSSAICLVACLAALAAATAETPCEAEDDACPSPGRALLQASSRSMPEAKAHVVEEGAQPSQGSAPAQAPGRSELQTGAREAVRHEAGVAGGGARGRAHGRRYLPDVHAQAVGEAFDAVVDKGGDIGQVLSTYRQAGMHKKTHGTCKWAGCYASRGKTDCLGGECLCQDGYGTKDRATCEGRHAQALASGDSDTGGTCFWGWCWSWRGPTTCVRSKCLCQTGYVALEGKCVQPAVADPARDIVYTMLTAGVREPDELSCPGDTFEQGSMNNAVLRMVGGDQHFNVSLCRMATQVYHASPLPMVTKEELNDAPAENGYRGEDNAVTSLYSLMTMRQWRTHTVQVMATEFVYAIAMPDLGEGAKRLGNLFHTLSDSFSASHTQRWWFVKDVSHTRDNCRQLTVNLTMSMDVMNFLVHPLADMESGDLLYACSRLYETEAIQLWAEARRQGVADAGAANAWVDRLVREVLCESLPLTADGLDYPAGGASEFFSVSLSGPALPRGTASEADAQRIVAGWAAGLAAKRATATGAAQRARPLGIALPPRSADVCADPGVAYVETAHVEAALKHQLPPQYLQPYF